MAGGLGPRPRLVGPAANPAGRGPSPSAVACPEGARPKRPNSTRAYANPSTPRTAPPTLGVHRRRRARSPVSPASPAPRANPSTPPRVSTGRPSGSSTARVVPTRLRTPEGGRTASAGAEWTGTGSGPALSVAPPGPLADRPTTSPAPHPGQRTRPPAAEGRTRSGRWHPLHAVVTNMNDTRADRRPLAAQGRGRACPLPLVREG